MTAEPGQAPDPHLERVRALAAQMLSAIPHARALGLEVTRVERGQVWGRTPYRPEIVGDPATGVIAGGVITTLLDNLSGFAVQSALEAHTTIATLDLRIDYMRAAEPGRDILAMAECYKLTRSVAFVRGVAYDQDEADPVANCTGAFMLHLGRKAGQNLKPPR